MEQVGKKNVYTCERCERQIVTVNLLDGVTPFMIQCRANWPGECPGMAKSEFYNVDQSLPAFWGWYRPDATELERLEISHPGTKRHVDQGGLLLRRLDNAERETYGWPRVRRG